MKKIEKVIKLNPELRLGKQGEKNFISDYV